jgi:hypothetical protein
MKYACLVYLDERSPETVADSECLAYGSKLRERGHYLAGEALQPVSAGTVVRLRNGTTTVTDGPYAETKEQLAGFYLIEAADLNEAIRIAAGIPPARLGSIEVRPVRELDAG